MSAFLEYFHELLGKENVINDPKTLQAYATTTFATTNSVLLVLKPATVDHIQKILKFANAERLTVYPVSRGCNWGLGSRVPISNNSLILDLEKMNNILNFDESQGFIEVEPGVTFNQLHHYLLEQNSTLFLSVIGGHPESSIIGNTLERGDGLGPLGDRAQHVCALEVVLSDGRVLRTGMSSFSNGEITNLAKDSLGPALDGLFFQSNFGIVTKMTVWLKRKSKEFTSGIVTFSSTKQLELALPAIRELQEQGIISGNCLAIWNIYKVLGATGQHPLLSSADDRPACLSENNIDSVLPAGLKGSRWLITFALYAPTTRHMRANCSLLKKLLKPRAHKFLLITKYSAYLGKLLARPVSVLLGFNVRPWLDSFYFRSIYRGFPSELSIRSLYWRKSGAIPSEVNPDADRCGLLWLCHLVPATPYALTEANQIIELECKRYGFEPNVALLNTSERFYRMFIAIMYDRDQMDEDSRALSCQESIQTKLHNAGFTYFRLGLQSMQAITPKDANYLNVIHSLKELFDPSNIIAPGRYDFSATEKKSLTNKKSAQC